MPEGNNLILNDYMPIAFGYNKGVAMLVELLLGKPSNM